MTIHSRYITTQGLRLHYRECGSGDPVLLLHGWPTSSFLWRHILPEIGKTHRAIALDLPGFGQSDKPTDMPFYTFRFYERYLQGFVETLGLENLSLAVHDLGGPVGLYWMVRHMEQVEKLMLLNTLVYPIPSLAAGGFVALCWVPGISDWFASPAGLKFAMELGMAQTDKITPEMLEGVQAPFVSKESRKALLKSIKGLSPQGLIQVSQILPQFKGPVRIVYGRKDKILPDVAKTMARVSKDLPQAKVTELPHCGHFLQEDAPEQVASLLSEFLNSP